MLDANVLFPLMLRDALVSLAVADVFEAKWTNLIHDEWIRNVLKVNSQTVRETLENTRRLMELHVPNALVEGFEPLIETLHLPDPNDRHVLAAAIHARADFIVTWNLKDFPPGVLSSHSIRALSPDVFAVDILQQSPQEVIAASFKIGRFSFISFTLHFMLQVQSDLSRLIEGKRDEERVEVPVSLLRAFIENTREKTLTTQAVADLLGVSRPFVVKLIDTGELPAERVGTHRRVRESDVLVWKRSNQNKRLQTLRELEELDKELGL